MATLVKSFQFFKKYLNGNLEKEVKITYNIPNFDRALSTGNVFTYYFHIQVDKHDSIITTTTEKDILAQVHL